MTDKSEIIAAASGAVSAGEPQRAQAIIRQDYPFDPRPAIKRQMPPLAMTRVFVADGFIDRYFGERLVFLPALRLLSHFLPDAFPYHPNWKMDACHLAYYELGATIDHVVPVARGGDDEATNWVTTSMLHNAIKAHWTVAELSWKLLPAGDFAAWDGMLPWFVSMLEGQTDLLQASYFRGWYRAAREVLGERARPWDGSSGNRLR